MNDERSNARSQQRVSLDRRLAARPELAEKVHALIDALEESLAQKARADDVEDCVQEKVRDVGLQALTDWAAQAQEQTALQTPAQHPGAVKHAKKNSSGKRSSGRSKSRNKSGA
jgi:uncharacterized protein YqeY